MSALEQLTQKLFGLQPDADRLNLLPYPKGALSHGKEPIDWTDWTAPEAIYSLAKAVTAPALAAQGQPYSAQDVVNTALSTGLSGLSMGGAPVGSAGMFIGKQAKKWDPMSHKVAVQMEAGGAHPRDIWSQTGNYRGADGQWRQELSDKAARINDFDSTRYSNDSYGKDRDLPDAINHNQLMQAYPDLNNYKMSMHSSDKNSIFDEYVHGALHPYIKKIGVYGAQSEPSGRRSALHEIQHVIQDKEGWSPGTNMNDHFIKSFVANQEKQQNLQRAQKLDDFILQNPGYKNNNELRKLSIKLKAMEPKKSITDEKLLAAYKRSAGEVEARATAARMNLTNKQRRAKFPEDSFDMAPSLRLFNP